MNQEIKKDNGKTRYELIPPKCLEELAKVYTFGAQKYTKDSWKDVELERLEGALFRHFQAYRKGEARNKEDGNLYHLAQVAWNAFSLLYHQVNDEI